MCEIPNNVILAEEFADLFDGFSIGSNDLTQLALGVDRDSELLSHLFDERDPGVKRLIRMVVEAAHRCGRKVGICGQAPSDFPDFAAFLAEIGIDSISLNPDSLPKVAARLAVEPETPLLEPQLAGFATPGCGC
jgi:pyruvate,water dikinase